MSDLSLAQIALLFAFLLLTVLGVFYLLCRNGFVLEVSRKDVVIKLRGQRPSS